MKNIQSPEKEIRFTRAGQAQAVWLAAAVLVGVVVTMLASAHYREADPRVPHQLWALLPLALAVAAVRLAIRLTRHAYLILTPLGIEIFPLFRPEKTMRMVLWQEVAAIDIDADLRRLSLHHNPEKTSGIHLSLAPIRRDRRALLAKAISGRLSPGGTGSASSLPNA